MKKMSMWLLGSLIAVSLLAGACKSETAPKQEEEQSAAKAETETETTPENTEAKEEETVAKSDDAQNNDPLAAPADVAAPPADAEKTASGLASKVLKAGTGTEHPTATSTVNVHYTGWTTDGKRFDSSVERGETISFPLNRVIAGWTEGLQLMVVGEKRRFWIPEELAYQGRPGAPAGMLVFDVELFEIK